MVRLGKAIKGRTKPAAVNKRIMVKIRNQEKTMEELEQDQIVLKTRRNDLRNGQVTFTHHYPLDCNLMALYRSKRKRSRISTA